MRWKTTARNSSFRPSYKGWKHCTVNHSPRLAGKVLDLPIRDGNKDAEVAKMLGVNVLDLPIRDGNKQTKLQEIAYERVLDLPIRDGNSLFWGS